MNNEDPFERRLQAQPFKPVPPGWRVEVLRAAQVPGFSTRSAGSAPLSRISFMRSRLLALFWPYPKAWAGLAAVWVVILGLNLSSRDPAGAEMARRPALPSPQIRQMLKQQAQMFAELLGPAAQPPSTPHKKMSPPRSQRLENLLNT